MQSAEVRDTVMIALIIDTGFVQGAGDSVSQHQNAAFWSGSMILLSRRCIARLASCL